MIVPFDIDIQLRVMARYWRLVFTQNHVDPAICVHGISFYGYDTRVVKLIEQLKLSEYEDVIIEHVSNHSRKIKSSLLKTSDRQNFKL